MEEKVSFEEIIAVVIFANGLAFFLGGLIGVVFGNEEIDVFLMALCFVIGVGVAGISVMLAEKVKEN